MRDECGALHFEILHALPGRLRAHLEKPSSSERFTCSLSAPTSTAYIAASVWISFSSLTASGSYRHSNVWIRGL